MQHTTIISSDNPKRLPFCPSPPAHINGAVVVTGGGNNMRRPLCSNDFRGLSLCTIFIRTIQISILPNFKYMSQSLQNQGKAPFLQDGIRIEILRPISKPTQNNHQTTACGGNAGGNTINQGLQYESKDENKQS
jgi:hypothetical protein